MKTVRFEKDIQNYNVYKDGKLDDEAYSKDLSGPYILASEIENIIEDFILWQDAECCKKNGSKIHHTNEFKNWIKKEVKQFLKQNP